MDYALYNTGVHNASAFILAVVVKVWVRKLCDLTTFYTNVLPSALVEHYEERCTRIHAINAINLLLIIQVYYVDVSRMLFYFNMIEDAQSKFQTTDLPLSDATLFATTTKAVFALKEYPDGSREWECDSKNTKMWAACKLRYKRAYKLKQIAHQD